MNKLIVVLALILSSATYANDHNYEEADIQCLAENIYFESRNQGKLGKIAVALVTLNRVMHPRWPNDICGVVKQAKMWGEVVVRHQCQFSWYCNSESDVPTDSKAWELSKQVAEGVLLGRTKGSVGKAIHYHAEYVYPKWAKTRPIVGKIGVHIFYE